MLLLVATAVAVVLSAAATALAASQSGNDSAKGNPGNKGSSGHNKDFAGLSYCHRSMGTMTTVERAPT